MGGDVSGVDARAERLRARLRSADAAADLTIDVSGHALDTRRRGPEHEPGRPPRRHRPRYVPPSAGARRPAPRCHPPPRAPPVRPRRLGWRRPLFIRRTLMIRRRRPRAVGHAAARELRRSLPRLADGDQQRPTRTPAATSMIGLTAVDADLVWIHGVSSRIAFAKWGGATADRAVHAPLRSLAAGRVLARASHGRSSAPR